MAEITDVRLLRNITNIAFVGTVPMAAPLSWGEGQFKLYRVCPSEFLSSLYYFRHPLHDLAQLVPLGVASGEAVSQHDAQISGL